MFLNENVHHVCGLIVAADRYDTNPATDVVSMKDHAQLTAILTEGAGGTGTATITVQACDDVTPSNTSAIAFKYRVLTSAGSADAWGALTDATSAGFTTTAGANKVILIFVEAKDLPDGFPYLRVLLTEVANSPVVAGVHFILSGNRYSKSTHATALT